MRAFCAIDIPAEVRAVLKQRIDTLRNEFGRTGISWQNPDKLHLTLKFFSEISTAGFSSLIERCEGAMADIHAFPLLTGAPGVFPKRGRPRVPWIGIEDPSGGLSRLHSIVERACQESGVSEDEEQFHPHITVARLKNPTADASVAKAHLSRQIPESKFTINALSFYKSELTSAGAIHTLFRSVPLI
jgi:2'-5' RNA ligase